MMNRRNFLALAATAPVAGRVLDVPPVAVPVTMAAEVACATYSGLSRLAITIGQPWFEIHPSESAEDFRARVERIALTLAEAM